MERAVGERLRISAVAQQRLLEAGLGQVVWAGMANQG